VSEQASIPVTIPATKAHRDFADLIRRTYSGKEHFIVERGGLPVVAIISMTEYEELMQERERHGQDKERRIKQFRAAARAIGEEVAKSGLTEEQLIAELEKDKQDIYEEYYGDNQDR
jgi:prevent-host-death family protein